MEKSEKIMSVNCSIVGYYVLRRKRRKSYEVGFDGAVGGLDVTPEGLIDRDHEVTTNRAIRSRLLDLQRLTRQTGINIDLNPTIVGGRLNHRGAIGLL